MEDTLTDKQRRYVENISRGMASREAARSAGYSESFARVAAHRIGGKPAVAQAIEEIQKKGREMAVYDLATAMREANEVCNFAKLHKNAMAYCKGTELRAKLSGLLIDRVEIATVDLSDALAKAEARVVNVQPLARQSCAELGSTADQAVPGAAYRGPGIPGDPFAERGHGRDE
jgi:phage terminase small subunit